MSTQSEIVYNIRNIIRENSDDSRLSNSQIMHMVNYARATLIRRDYENKHTINPQIEQSLGCLELEQVDKAECCDIETDCMILRTKVDLPKFVEVYNKNLITYVGSVDNTTDFQIISNARARWTSYDKYTKNIPRAILRGNRLYIINDKYISNITVRGILDNPTDAYKYKNCDESPCFTASSEYPLASWMEQAIFDMLRKGELTVFFTSLVDKTNNASDDKQSATKNGG